MDMKKILENMDAAAAGKKPAGAADAGSMKSILESLNKVAECGTDMMASQQMGQSEGTPVTVSITASGKDHVNDLMDLIKLAGGNAEQHIDMPMAHDTHIDTDSHNASGQEMDMATMRSIMAAGEDDGAVEDEVEEWANSPEGVEGEEEYRDHEYMTRDLSGGINRAKPKGSERVKDPAVESIKEKLWAALNEKKTTESADRSLRKHANNLNKHIPDNKRSEEFVKIMATKYAAKYSIDADDLFDTYNAMFSLHQTGSPFLKKETYKESLQGKLNAKLGK